LASQVGQSPDARHRVRNAAGLLLRLCDQLREAVDAKLGINSDRLRLQHRYPDGGEIARQLEREIGRLARYCQEHRRGRCIDCVAVRWRLRRSRSRNRPPASGPCLDHDLLSPSLAQAFGDAPRVGVYGAARRRIQNEPYRLVRIVPRLSPRATGGAPPPPKEKPSGKWNPPPNPHRYPPKNPNTPPPAAPPRPPPPPILPPRQKPP